MLEHLQSLITPALMQRLTLLLNHVIASEPVATQRLRPHAGRHVQLQVLDWPPALPAWPSTVFAITPAGLLEWVDSSALSLAPAPDLLLSVRAANPAQILWSALQGQRPQVDVSGDANLAADISWLMDNLRWDVQDDLSRLMGQIPAHELGRLAQSAASALREMVGRLSTLAKKAAPGSDNKST
jgi:ubiquinone biosynthesis protein UbiJ